VNRIGADVNGSDAHLREGVNGRAGRRLASYMDVIYCPFRRLRRILP
jgi:hypothetical protein